MLTKLSSFFILSTIFTILLFLDSSPATYIREEISVFNTEISPTKLPISLSDETIIQLSGVFYIVLSDPAPGSNQLVGTSYFLTDSEGQTTELLVQESFDSSSESLWEFDKKHVTVQGVWVSLPDTVEGRTPAFSVSKIQIVLLGNRFLDSLAPDVSGNLPWLSILCKFANIADEPRNLAFFQNMYASTYPGLDHYWREQSYNNANVLGSRASGWYTLPYPHSHYIYDRDGNGSLDADLDALARDCTAKGDIDIYFPAYIGINLMFNYSLDGYAYGGSAYLTLDGITSSWRTTWEPPWGYSDIAVIEHEMGHGFGMPHSSGNYGFVYDNYWDVMSKDGRYYNNPDPIYGHFGQHTISYHKDKSGWILPSEKYTALPGSQALITLERLALPQTNNYKMVQIPIWGSSNLFYTVEARRQAGYDAILPGNGVIIHEVNKNRSEPAHVIDIDGNGNTGDSGAIWNVGERFIDATHGITVTVSAETATGYTIQIQISDYNRILLPIVSK
jgi:M6 family metalloprotease-like protein